MNRNEMMKNKVEQQQLKLLIYLIVSLDGRVKMRPVNASVMQSLEEFCQFNFLFLSIIFLYSFFAIKLFIIEYFTVNVTTHFISLAQGNPSLSTGFTLNCTFARSARGNAHPPLNI